MGDELIVDGQLNEDEAKRIIKKFTTLLCEDCLVCTMYPNPPEIQHLDHRRLRLTAQELKKEGLLSTSF